jgi:hypothetical protein
MKSECWLKGGSNEGGGPKRSGDGGDSNTNAGGTLKSGAAAVAEEPDIKAWAAVEEVFMAGDPLTNFSEAELYDSGALCHMSPFCNKFLTYQKIAPQLIVAADKRVFYAVGVGDLVIQVPHGKSSTPIILKEALYAPDIAVTIVAVNRIMKAGFSVTFEGDLCSIKKEGRTIGTIPASVSSLYKVDHVASAVMLTVKRVTLPMLHRCLGHVSVDNIHLLL